MSNDSERRWSRCSAGTRGWYWMVMRSQAECDAAGIQRYNDEHPIASGFEPTCELAEAKAREAAGPDAWQANANHAQGYLRRLAIEKRMARKPKSEAPLEFVWEAEYWVPYDDPRPSRWVISQHRVVKKSATRVYVEKHEFDPVRWQEQCEAEASGQSQWWQHDIPTLILDRKELERGRGAKPKETRRDRWVSHGDFYPSEKLAQKHIERAQQPEEAKS